MLSPSHDSLGQTRQKLHLKLVNDCLQVRLHHHLSNLSTREANLQPGLFTGVMRGHRHVTCGLVMTDSAKANNAMSSRNHEVVEERNLVKTFLNFSLVTVMVYLLGYAN